MGCQKHYWVESGFWDSFGHNLNWLIKFVRISILKVFNEMNKQKQAETKKQSTADIFVK